MYKSIIIFIALLFLNACGFHLASEGEFSNELDNTSIEAVSSSKDLLRLVEKNLRSNNINVVSEQEATAKLRILNEEIEKTVLTLDNDGKVREYELILRITFEVQRADKSSLLNQQVIELNRDFVFDKSDLLGANEEEQELYSEMRNDAAKLIIYRLQAI